jgi:DNA-binding response OmpR family regulator
MGTVVPFRINRLQIVAQTAQTKVLVVEDSILTAKQLCESIAGLSHAIDCSTAATEKDALHIIMDSVPDIVVLDLHLKDGNGFTVLKAVKAMRRKPITIVLTNFALPQYRDYAFLLGADFFFDKALEFETIPPLLDTLVAQRTMWQRE